MKEIEFKYHLYRNYSIEYEHIDMFTYRIEIKPYNFILLVSYTDYYYNDSKKILPMVSILTPDKDVKYYQSFKKVINYIENYIKKEGENIE